MASNGFSIEPFSRAGPTPKDLEQTADLEKVWQTAEVALPRPHLLHRSVCMQFLQAAIS